MNRVKAVASLMLTVLFLAGCAAGPQVRDDASVREAVDIFIRGKTVYNGGVYVIKGVDTEFDLIRDGISEGDGNAVLCADFTGASNLYDIDFYVKQTGTGYRVVKTVLHKKNGTALNEILWIKGAVK